MALPRLQHFLRRRSWFEWLVFVVLLAGSAILGNTLSSSTVWIAARGAIYQVLTTFGGSDRTPERTALVLLDDTDYWTEAGSDPAKSQLAGRTPTNRKYLALLIDRLAAANVGVIVLDFDLRSPDPKGAADDLPEYGPEDSTLFESISKACSLGSRIVLATELLGDSDGLHPARNIYDSAGLPQTCVRAGYIELPRDIRRVPVTVPTAAYGDADSLSLAAVGAADVAAHAASASPEDKDFPYSRFLQLSAFEPRGPHQTRFTGREIEAADPRALAAQLHNRIVLIGADWHTLAFGEGPLADQHPSPAHDLPGVVLHANYVEAALLRGLGKPFPESIAILLEILLVICLSILGLLEIHWAWKWSAVLISSLGVILFSYLLLRRFGLMLDFFFPLIFLGLHSGFEHVREWRHGDGKE
jgi:CHASE2 domain-containing sensor protein